jgi:hypothetical protein
MCPSINKQSQKKKKKKKKKNGGTSAALLPAEPTQVKTLPSV